MAGVETQVTLFQYHACHHFYAPDPTFSDCITSIRQFIKVAENFENLSAMEKVVGEAIS